MKNRLLIPLIAALLTCAVIVVAAILAVCWLCALLGGAV